MKRIYSPQACRRTRAPARMWRHAWRRSLLAGLIATSVAIPSLGDSARPLILQPINLPDIGDPSGAVLTPTDEHNLGDSLYQSLRESGDLLEDPQVNAYIQGLGERLLSSADTTGQRYHFFVVNADNINAFAAPGGYIGVFTGLIEFTDREDELAAVLAHEIAHVTQRHMARTFEAAERFSIPMAVAVLTAILLARGGDSQVAEAALYGGLASGAQQQINFTRANEEEADRVGINTLGNAGFDPHFMGEFFGRLERESRYYGEQAPEFLRTHPVNSTRVADALGRADAWGHPKDPDPQVFELMRMRVKVLTARDPRELLKQLQADHSKETPRRRIAIAYGRALLLNKLEHYAEATQLLDGLLKTDALRVPYYVARSDATLALGHPAAAEKQLREALSLYPGDHTLIMSLARAELDNDNAEQAFQLLRNHQREGNSDRDTWTLLATAAAKAGHRVEAHEAQAEKYLLEDSRDLAIQQLKQAQRAAQDDIYASSRIASRLRELEDAEKDDKNKDKVP